MTFEKINRYQVMSRPRHIRYMFFVEFNYPYDKLIRLSQVFVSTRFLL